MAEILRQKKSEDKVRIHAAEYLSKEAIGSSSVIYFLAGYALRGDSKAIKPLGTALSKEYPDKRIITVSARPKKAIVSYDEEVAALQRDIISREIKHVTIVGYSESTTKAVSLAHDLAANSEIRVDSLVLAAPLGITEVQRPAGKLIRSMFCHIPLTTVQEIIRDPKEWRSFFHAFSTSIGVFKGIGEEFAIQGRRYPSQVRRDIYTMSKQNQSISDGIIDSIPTLIMAADNDNIVPYEHVLNAVQGRRQTRVVAIANGSHGFPFIQPKRFVQRMAGELSEMQQWHSHSPSGVNAGR